MEDYFGKWLAMGDDGESVPSVDGLLGAMRNVSETMGEDDHRKIAAEATRHIAENATAWRMDNRGLGFAMMHTIAVAAANVWRQDTPKVIAKTATRSLSKRTGEVGEARTLTTNDFLMLLLGELAEARGELPKGNDSEALLLVGARLLTYEGYTQIVTTLAACVLAGAIKAVYGDTETNS